MQKHIAILDICGLEVALVLTDDKRLLGSKKGMPSFGRYNVDEGYIWLDANVNPSVLRSHLFHEVYEFTLGYFNVSYNPENEHESFMRFSNVLWAVFKTNKAILFGSRLMELLKENIDGREKP